MLIAHFSDTHGLPRKAVLDEADLIVISGDVMPNRTYGNAVFEEVYQAEWIRKTSTQWKIWAKGKPVFLINGNHDYIDPAPLLREAGIRAVLLGDDPVEFKGLLFSGIPDVPWFGGGWNHERGEAFIAAHLEAILSKGPDVLVGHCPPLGVLDRVTPGHGMSIGSSAIYEALSSERGLLAYLCGHCHEQGGKLERLGSSLDRLGGARGVLVSNAATKRNMVSVEALSPHGRGRADEARGLK